ncbi:MAG: ATP-binding protein [Clostridiales bacterium]|nr:ATP-binding protein [Clostridiales bacterium]
MTYLHRHIEDIVDKLFKTFKSVLVTGARQTGKSTLLETKYPYVKAISFDDTFMESQAKGNPDMFLSMSGTPLFLDEVQYVPSLFRYLKMHCDKNKVNGQYLLTGSQPFRLMDLASDSMAGRIAVVELATLSFREICQSEFKVPFIPTIEYIQSRKDAENPGNVWNVIHRGFYPEMQNPDLDWSMFYSSYVKTYLERDVRELSNVQDLTAFRNLMIACAARTGQMLNYSNIADEIGKDSTTVKKWISILEASGLIYILEPFANSVLKRAIKTPKLYFRDTGLAAYLTRWLTPESLANGAMSGSFFETFVISEILKSYSNRGIDYRYFVSYYRGKDKKKATRSGTEQFVESEIDFIIEQDGVLYPIEIKKDENPDANMTSAFQVLNDLPDKKRGIGAVICSCPAPGMLRENVFAIPWFYV